MKKYNVGIIGLGVGEEHIKGYQSHQSCEVVALCDFSEEKIRSVKRRYPFLKIVKDADEILLDEGINIVSIASYDNYHYEQIIKAIHNEKHVFVEKPLCLYKKEAVEIRKLLQNKPHLKLSSNLILRESPRFKLLKKMIQEGEFGNVFYVEGDYNYGRLHKLTDGWRGKIDFYSIVYGGGVHIVDLLLWLTGDDITEVSAYGNNKSSKRLGFRYNDIVVSLLRFESGTIGKVACNFPCVYPHFHSLLIYGTNATFVNDFDSGRLFCTRDSNVPFRKIKEAYPGVHKGDLIYSFVDSITTGSEAGVTADDVFRAMSVCFAIEESSYSSRPVKVEYI